jgi:hypothetical protein
MTNAFGETVDYARNVGVYTYTLSLLDTNYTIVDASGKAVQDLVVTPKQVMLEWKDAASSSMYTGKAHDISAVVSNVCVGDKVKVISYEGTLDAIQAGTYTATATAIDNSNYTLEGADVTYEYTIDAIILTIDFIAPQKVGDSLDVNLVGVVEGDDVELVMQLTYEGLDDPTWKIVEEIVGAGLYYLDFLDIQGDDINNYIFTGYQTMFSVKEQDTQQEQA